MTETNVEFETVPKTCLIAVSAPDVHKFDPAEKRGLSFVNLQVKHTK